MTRTITTMVKVAAGLGLAVMVVLAASTLTTPVKAEGCEPVACPAIAKICPQGQIACHPSPCSCALSCVPEGHGCNG